MGNNEDNELNNANNEQNEDNSANNVQNEDNSANNTNNSDDSASEKKNEKLFTQEQVSQMMAREKNQGRRSVFKELGINPKDEKMINTVKAFAKSSQENSDNSSNADDEAINEANHRALVAEAKAEAMILGAQKQYVDDLVTLALNNLDDNGDLKTVFGELKTKYPIWFEPEESKENQGKKGTGSSLSNNKKGNSGSSEAPGIGSRLAAQRRAQNYKKSSFFNR